MRRIAILNIDLDLPEITEIRQASDSIIKDLVHHIKVFVLPSFWLGNGFTVCVYDGWSAAVPFTLHGDIHFNIR